MRRGEPGPVDRKSMGRADRDTSVPFGQEVGMRTGERKISGHVRKGNYVPDRIRERSEPPCTDEDMFRPDPYCEELIG